jgi:hypothetical protein
MSDIICTIVWWAFLSVLAVGAAFPFLLMGMMILSYWEEKGFEALLGELLKGIGAVTVLFLIGMVFAYLQR